MRRQCTSYMQNLSGAGSASSLSRSYRWSFQGQNVSSRKISPELSTSVRRSIAAFTCPRAGSHAYGLQW